MSSSRLKWSLLDFQPQKVKRQYHNRESQPSPNEQKQIISQRRPVENIKALQEQKNLESSRFKPSIKIFYKNGKLETPRESVRFTKIGESVRYFENQRFRKINPPQSSENVFFNEQRYLLPHQRVRTPNTRVKTEQTDRVFDGVRTPLRSSRRV